MSRGFFKSILPYQSTSDFMCVNTLIFFTAKTLLNHVLINPNSCLLISCLIKLFSYYERCPNQSQRLTYLNQFV